MITTKKLFGVLIAFTMSLVMVSCAGEDGEPGPAGPAGNANVIANTYTIPGGTWVNGIATISVPELTKDIVDNGQVSVFITTDTLGQDTITWEATPWQFLVNFGGQLDYVTMRSRYSIGEIELVAIRRSSGQGVNFTNDFSAKVVLIPASSALEGVDVNNYEALEAVYGLE